MSDKKFLPPIIPSVFGVVIVVLSFIFMPTTMAVINLVLLLGIVAISTYSRGQLSKAKTTTKHEEEQLTRVINNMREGVIIYTSDFKITKINEATEKIYGISSDDVVGKTLSPEAVNEKNLSAFAQTIFPSLAPVTNQVSAEGWPQIVKIGTENPELSLITVLDKLEGDNKIVFIKIIQDRTREDKLLESKTEFITTSAHQLRTPITAISWAFESIGSSVKQDDLKDIANQGLDLSNRALRIINDLLGVIQIEEGEFGYEFQQSDVVKLVNNAINDIKPIAKESDIEVALNAPPEAIVSMDQERIRMALTALIENAIIYNTKDGSVNISIKDGGGNFWQIDIKDTGIGINDDEQKSLFKKFSRGREASKTNPNGSGLGLYLVKKIVEKHGGKIWINSTPGRGSTFSFTLPK